MLSIWKLSDNSYLVGQDTVKDCIGGKYHPYSPLPKYFYHLYTRLVLHFWQVHKLIYSYKSSLSFHPPSLPRFIQIKPSLQHYMFIPIHLCIYMHIHSTKNKLRQLFMIRKADDEQVLILLSFGSHRSQ